MSRVDLHVHSTASDGKESPEDVVRRAAGLGLEFLALTDHDTLDGLAAAREAAREFPRLTLIPGVEISTDLAEGEAHVLGYFVDETSRELTPALARFRNSRVGRARGMVERLAGLGLPLEWERVLEIAGEGSVGRPHIARAMLEKGYISSFEEAFDKYIGHGGPAYVGREKMTPEEAVSLIKRSGGIPVLAHPFTLGNNNTVVAMVTGLCEVGLAGIEAYYKDNTPEETQRMLVLAERFNLIPTGGSDYHGEEDGNDAMLGSVDVPRGSAEKLIAMAGPAA